MKDYKLGKHTLTLYASIKEMPADVFSEMQKYTLQDAGIGSTMADVNSHLNKLDMFLASGKTDEARQERINLQQNIFLMLSGINITSYVFGCLVHAVDGKEVKDRSESGLKALLEKLQGYGLTYGLVSDTLDEVKKKLILN